MWLSNAVVVDTAGSTRPDCWVEVAPTGRFRQAHDGAPVAGVVLDAGGAEIVAAPHHGVAEALLDAIVTGDRAAADELYADDLVVWHNHDGIERDKGESLDLIRAMAEEFASVKATDVRRDYLVDGFVQRTTFEFADASGPGRSVDTMMRVWVEDTRITRIEEYALGAAAEHAGS